MIRTVGNEVYNKNTMERGIIAKVYKKTFHVKWGTAISVYAIDDDIIVNAGQNLLENCDHDEKETPELTEEPVGSVQKPDDKKVFHVEDILEVLKTCTRNTPIRILSKNYAFGVCDINKNRVHLNKVCTVDEFDDDEFVVVADAIEYFKDMKNQRMERVSFHTDDRKWNLVNVDRQIIDGAETVVFTLSKKKKK